MRQELLLLDELLDHISENISEFDDSPIFKKSFYLNSGFKVEIRTEIIYMARTKHKHKHFDLKIINKQSEIVVNYSPPGAIMPLVITDILDVIVYHRDEISSEINAISGRLDTIETSSPDVWSFVDFLYFSLITQTTVGYGDILPNSTRIRKIVMGQVIVGYIMLVVIINLSVGSESAS